MAFYVYIFRNLKNSYTFNKLKRDPSPYPPRSMADSPLKRERYVGTGLVPVRRGFRGRIPLKYVPV